MIILNSICYFLVLALGISKTYDIYCQKVRLKKFNLSNEEYNLYRSIQSIMFHDYGHNSNFSTITMLMFQECIDTINTVKINNYENI